MKRFITRITLALAVVFPIAFYAGYLAHKERVFPLRPFVKRALHDIGVPPSIIDALRGRGVPDVKFSSNEIEVKSVHYNFDGKIFDLPTSAEYGAIALLQDRIVFADGHGLLWLFDNGNFTDLGAKKIPNLNGVDDSKESREQYPFAVVKGIAVIGGFIYASATEYFASEKCIKLSVFKIGISGSVDDPAIAGEWEKVFSTDPCLTGVEDKSLDMIQAGGRIVSLSDTEILLSVGEYGQNGIIGEAYSQDSSAHYGKMIKLDLTTFTPEIYTSGHRNPQGLLITEDGTIFSTEHGPHGGDELNLIKPGKNYGWPLVTFGVEYNRHDWPLDQGPSHHEGYEKPLFSWVPSIGISNLIQIKDPALVHWSNDLLIATLFEVSLYRMKLNGHRPILMEPIYIGSRIRDLVSYKNGFALQLDQENRLLILEPIPEEVPDPADKPAIGLKLSAAQIYKSACGNCHDAGRGGAPQTGKRDDWESRYEKGFDTLVKHTIEGFNAMPAKGGNRYLSDDDVKKAIAYMLEESEIQVE